MKTTSMGRQVHWARSTIDLAVVPTGSAGRDALLRTATQRAALAWSGIGEVMVHVVDAPKGSRVSATQGSDYVPGEAEQNVVAWAMGNWRDDDDMLALTFLHYTADTGAIIDADILVNDEGYRWIDAEDDHDDGAYDLANALTHEMGHVLGLGHSEVLVATMFPSSASMETAKRSLDEDDEAGIRAVYKEIDDPVEVVSAPLDPPYGCQTTAPDGAALALLVLLAAALGRRARRAGGSLLLGLLIGVGTAARATPPDALRERVLARADAVAEVEVVAQEVEIQDGLRVTVSTLRVDRCRAGTCPRTLILEQLGGERDGIGLFAEGITPVKLGDALTVAARVRGARWRLVGRDHGVLLDLRRADPADRAQLERLLRVAR